jgi:predicted transcriptional regulator
MSEQAQQAFLKAAKEALGMTWDEIAVAAGIVPRTFKNYRMPDGSQNYRPMPRLARDAVQRLLDDHAGKNRKKAA